MTNITCMHILCKPQVKKIITPEQRRAVQFNHVFTWLINDFDVGCWFTGFRDMTSFVFSANTEHVHIFFLEVGHGVRLTRYRISTTHIYTVIFTNACTLKYTHLNNTEW